MAARVAGLLVAALLAVPCFADSGPSSSAIEALLSNPAQKLPEAWDLQRWREPLLRLYATRSYAPLWFHEGLPGRAAYELLDELAQAEERGLLVSDYESARLRQRVEAVSSPGEALAAADVALSVAAARIASDLSQGRVHPREAGYDLDIPQEKMDIAAAVARIATGRNVSAELDALEPAFLHYRLLRLALAQYRAMPRDPELTRLPALPSRSVKPGERYMGAPRLRALLMAVGDLAGSPAPAPEDAFVMDPALVDALKRFQMRHGLDPDGVLGRATFAALSVPLSHRIQQIVLSLERMRWLPGRLETPPIIVNVPQFRLFAFRTTRDRADEILQMKVIVGSTFPGRRTPVFAADMRYIVLNPYWDVPRSILLRELLPSIRANPAWVDAHGYEIVQGPGDDARPVPATEENVRRLEAGQLRLRQKPGPNNALGRVKFMFPNQYNVYLHDTPARELFARSRRAFSHGCIRVEEPMVLLRHVLRNEMAWTQERIDAALRRGRPVRVPLSQPIRVHILYGTALATESGTVEFYEDLYDHDTRLTALIESRRRRGS